MNLAELELPINMEFLFFIGKKKSYAETLILRDVVYWIVARKDNRRKFVRSMSYTASHVTTEYPQRHVKTALENWKRVYGHLLSMKAADIRAERMLKKLSVRVERRIRSRIDVKRKLR